MHRVQVGGPRVSEQRADEEPADGQAATWSPPGDSGTLLAVLPVNNGSARMAIVGYLLPEGPVPVAAGRAVGTRRAADAARPVTAIQPGRSRPDRAPSPPPPAPSPAAPAPLAAGGLVVDTAGRRVLAGGRDAGLVYLEFELLRFLVVNAGRAFTRAQIFRSVWGEEPYESTRTVDIHVHRIRRKLGPEHGRNLVTVRRIGYRYGASPAG